MTVIDGHLADRVRNRIQDRMPGGMEGRGPQGPLLPAIHQVSQEVLQGHRYHSRHRHPDLQRVAHFLQKEQDYYQETSRFVTNHKY